MGHLVLPSWRRHEFDWCVNSRVHWPRVNWQRNSSRDVSKSLVDKFLSYLAIKMWFDTRGHAVPYLIYLNQRNDKLYVERYMLQYKNLKTLLPTYQTECTVQISIVLAFQSDVTFLWYEQQAAIQQTLSRSYFSRCRNENKNAQRVGGPVIFGQYNGIWRNWVTTTLTWVRFQLSSDEVESSWTELG